jgi:mevalonate kinase
LRLDVVSHLDSADGTKLGLGGSAAVTVAIVAAIFALAEVATDPPEQFHDAVFATAWRAHRAAQNGIGSGADVAASTYGGIVRFALRPRGLPEVAPLPRPGNAILLAAWTGATATTVDLVRRYLALPYDERRSAFLRASRANVDRLANALRCGSISAAALDSGSTALSQLAASTGLPLLTPRLLQLLAIARAHGAPAKSSGAGGGDCGIALTTDVAAAQRIRNAWRAAGLVPLDLALSGQGVTVGTA